MREKKYQVCITIYNSFDVKADSKEDAETKVRDFSDSDILNDSDFNINYIDEITMSASKTTKKELLSLVARIATAYEEKAMDFQPIEKYRELYDDIISTLEEAESE